MSSSTQRASHTVGWAAAPLGSPTAEWETAAFAQAEPLNIFAERAAPVTWASALRV